MRVFLDTNVVCDWLLERELWRTDAQITKLQEELAAMGKATTPSEFVEHDIAFHMTVAESAGNSALRDVHSSIQALLRAWILRALSGSNIELSYAEHLPIVDAIITGDPDASRLTMKSHMAAAAERLKANLPNTGDIVAPDFTEPA